MEGKSHLYWEEFFCHFEWCPLPQITTYVFDSLNLEFLLYGIVLPLFPLKGLDEIAF